MQEWTEQDTQQLLKLLGRLPARSPLPVFMWFCANTVGVPLEAIFLRECDGRIEILLKRRPPKDKDPVYGNMLAVIGTMIQAPDVLAPGRSRTPHQQLPGTAQADTERSRTDQVRRATTQHHFPVVSRRPRACVPTDLPVHDAGRRNPRRGMARRRQPARRHYRRARLAHRTGRAIHIRRVAAHRTQRIIARQTQTAPERFPALFFITQSYFLLSVLSARSRFPASP